MTSERTTRRYIIILKDSAGLAQKTRSAETDGGLIKASALRQGSLSLQYTCRMLEGELKSELDFARPCVAIEATKTCRSAMTKVRVVDIVDESQIRTLKPGEVHAIKEIEDLGAELNAVTLTNSPILIHRKVDILARRHSYYAATQTSELTFSR